MVFFFARWTALKPAALPIVIFLFAPGAVGQAKLDDGALSPHRAFGSSPVSLLRKSVDLVLLNVTVLDHSDRAVVGLQQKDFVVVDDKRERSVKYLSTADEPASLVIIFDASASMAGKIPAERKAIKELVQASNVEDEFSLVLVQDEPHLLSRFGDDVDLQLATEFIQARGFTALWDGIYLGVQELQYAHNKKKAIIVMSDGGDNHSRYSESDLKLVLEEADAAMYAIGIFEWFPRRPEEKLGPLQLDQLTSLTGGQLFSVRDASELSPAMTQISRRLRNQYLLGYYAPDQDHDGRWHKVRVQLGGSLSTAKLRLYAKRGYYAAVQ